MATVQALSRTALQKELAQLSGWTVADGKLTRTFEFRDFVEAFGFMVQVAMRAESVNHHPEWSNVYRRVTIHLVTHEAGNAISARDVDLARQINQIIEKPQR